MASIKNQDYELPKVHAQLYSRTFNTGTNTPVLLRGYDEVSEQDLDVIVKFFAARRMSKEASVRELVAAFIAMEWNISVVEPAIVNITSEFVKTMRGQNVYQTASKSLGLNVGSLYIDDYRQIVINDNLSEAQKKHAKRIFCFDAFIMNTDRTFEKPNMITDGKNITIFDHEASFSFLKIIGGYDEPWDFDMQDQRVLENHVLYHKLKNSSIPKDYLSEKIDLLDDVFWNKVKTLVPNEWKTDQIAQIEDHVNSLIDHKSEFITELERVLA